MIFRKKQLFTTEYDPDTQYPVIRSSICNGAKIAGFKNKTDGHFTEVLFIRSDADIDAFKKACGLDEIKTEY